MSGKNLSGAPLRVLDLFAGAGGLSHGLERAGLQIVGGVDFDADSVETYRHNHKNTRALQADLLARSTHEVLAELGIAPGDIDLLAGGPPCQGFSRNRARRHLKGEFVDDPRNDLFWTFFKYVEVLEPTWVLMENVPDLLVKKNGYFLKAITDRFESLGYQMTVQVLNAAEYGVPQLRRRAFFLARKGPNQRAPVLPFPKTTPGQRALDRTRTSRTRNDITSVVDLQLFDSELEVGPSVWDAISDLSGSYPEEFGGSTAYATEAANQYQQKLRGRKRMVANHFPWPLTPLQLSRAVLLKPGQGQDHLPPSLQVAGGYGSAYRRLDPDAVALTLTTWLFHPGSGMFTHPFEHRVLTIREAARIQSFSDGFEFLGRYHSQARQVGNAVAPLVAEAIGRVIQAQS